jgi:hypothetical protein
MASKERRIASLENKIQHREAALADARARVNATAEAKIENGSAKQKEFWADYRVRALTLLDEREAKTIEPLRAEYRTLLGLDQ